MTETGARAVLFDRYGDRDVLYVADVPMPTPAAGEVVVAVKAAGINPGEAKIRSGALRDSFPATFPSGEGSDLAGVVVAVGDGVDDFAVDDAVLGFSWSRSSHATHVAVPASRLIHKPAELSWEVAGSLYVVGCTAYAAVRAIDAKAGETVAVSAAAGGVGTVVVQLLALREARVLGIASPSNAEWLQSHGAVPRALRGRAWPGVCRRRRRMGSMPSSISSGPSTSSLPSTSASPATASRRSRSFAKAQELGVKSDGSGTASTPEVLSEMAGLVASGAIEIPIAATYPLDRVADAFEELERGHTRGKIVLIP